MDNEDSQGDKPTQDPTSDSNMKNGSSNQKDYREDDMKSTSGPTLVFLWVWNWFATLPQTITNLFVDIKNGDFLSKFSFLDAMLQFIVAVATSCHPQEEAYSGESDEKPEISSKEKDIKPFGGTGRTLRSRTVETNS